MKKKVAFTLLLCVAWVLSAFAQQTVESIRKEYQAVHEMIAQMTPSGDDTPEFSGKTIPEKFRQETNRCQQRAERFLTMFKGIDDNTYL